MDTVSDLQPMLDRFQYAKYRQHNWEHARSRNTLCHIRDYTVRWTSLCTGQHFAVTIQFAGRLNHIEKDFTYIGQRNFKKYWIEINHLDVTDINHDITNDTDLCPENGLADR